MSLKTNTNLQNALEESLLSFSSPRPKEVPLGISGNEFKTNLQNALEESLLSFSSPRPKEVPLGISGNEFKNSILNC